MMRLSADDPRARDAKVYLDGVELRNCVTADEENGECICFALDADGRPFGLTGHGEFVTETRRGVVRIVLQ